MINSELKSVSIDEFLQRVGAQPDGNVWSTLVAPSSDFDQILEELRGTLEIFAECEIGVISAKNGAHDLIEQIAKAIEAYLLLWDFESWSREDWREFDYLRSRLDKNKRGEALILSLESTKAMLSYAPNCGSWLGARVFGLILGEELLTEEERQARLSALREWSELSDAEMIELAEAKQLPADPEYGEWLILLGREDLIER